MEQIDPIIISLRNHQNQAYTGLLGVGPQLFRVSFHTGMKGIWIPGRIHRVPNQVHAYDGAVSPTYNEAPGTLASIRLRNGAVTISGRRRTEHMMLGPMGNLVMVGPQEFVVYRRVVPRQFYINLPYDGFVGLGLPLPANIDAVGAVPIW
ncbi:hypothetical protein F2Q70_00041070 [Brassica cretica]|nr:hypothetical protein F2Q70_00041070 [Brassica cretica]